MFIDKVTQAPELYAILQQDKLAIRPFPNQRKEKREIKLRIEIDNTDARDKMQQKFIHIYIAQTIS